MCSNSSNVSHLKAILIMYVVISRALWLKRMCYALKALIVCPVKDTVLYRCPAARQWDSGVIHFTCYPFYHVSSDSSPHSDLAPLFSPTEAAELDTLLGLNTGAAG
jgi:hypothetical protein